MAKATQAKQKIRCAAIGYGASFNMGFNHGNWINGADGMVFTAVCDIDPLRVEVAAKDFPGINFVIFHSGLKPLTEYPQDHLDKFNQTGRIDWVTDLAEIPAKYGVSNVYAELGSCFANSVVSHPQHAAGLLGTLIKGMGADQKIGQDMEPLRQDCLALGTGRRKDMAAFTA